MAMFAPRLARWLARTVALGSAGALILIAGPAHAVPPQWRLAGRFTSFRDLLVSARGPSDIWVSGTEGDGLRLDVEHWDGMRWRQIKPPRHIGLLDLSYPDPIGSSSAADAWVFGAYYRGDALLTYSLHWHDGRWDLRR